MSEKKPIYTFVFTLSESGKFHETSPVEGCRVEQDGPEWVVLDQDDEVVARFKNVVGWTKTVVHPFAIGIA